MILVANKVDLVHQRKITEDAGRDAATTLKVKFMYPLSGNWTFLVLNFSSRKKKLFVFYVIFHTDGAGGWNSFLW